MPSDVNLIATTQLELNVLSPEPSARLDALNLAQTITVTEYSSSETAPLVDVFSLDSSNDVAIDTPMSIGRMSPALRIVHGGMRLPSGWLTWMNKIFAAVSAH
jgi:hypothetical protein